MRPTVHCRVRSIAYQFWIKENCADHQHQNNNRFHTINLFFFLHFVSKRSRAGERCIQNKTAWKVRTSAMYTLMTSIN